MEPLPHLLRQHRTTKFLVDEAFPRASVGDALKAMRNSKRPKSVHLMSAVSIVVTLGLVGWSIMQFGL